MLRRSGRRFLASWYLRFLSSFTREDGSRAATFGGTFTVNQPGACETPSFAAASNFGAGSLPFSVAMGDFNHALPQCRASGKTECAEPI
jgi:hypothetical protein